MNCRVVVMGANGLVGSRLCRILADRGAEVSAAGRGPQRFDDSRVRYASVDLTQTKEVDALIAEQKPDVVVNSASMTDLDACQKAPWEAYRANVALPAELAHLSGTRGFHLVQVSTDYVFDGERGPYGVDDVPNPRGVYATTKHAGEQAVRVLGASWAIARTAVVYGWPAAGRSNFGAWLVSSLAEGKRVKLFSDQYISPSLALNVAEMLAELAERRLPGIWNTSGATVVDRVGFGRALCAVFGFDEALIEPTRLSDMRLAVPRPPRAGLNVERTASTLSTQPLELDIALRRFLVEYRGASIT